MADARPRRRRKKANKHDALLKANRHRYDAILESQGGTCALCPAVAKTRKLDLDHDHKRLVIRGLLCHRCNRALPDWITVEWLTAAIPYIQGEV